MATLTVWGFDTPEGADQAEQTLLDLQRQQLITVDDAAVVSWPETHRKPRIKQLHSLIGLGALSGTFWGLLFGLIFLLPLLGAAVGAAAGAVAGKLTDIGIDDDFIQEVGSRVTPGTSALFLLSQDEVPDSVHAAFPVGSAHLVHSNLDEESEAKLRELFSG